MESDGGGWGEEKTKHACKEKGKAKKLSTEEGKGKKTCNCKKNAIEAMAEKNHVSGKFSPPHFSASGPSPKSKYKDFYEMG